VIRYNPKLKEKARCLRAQMTDSERVPWARLRRKQVRSVQFYRQKPIGNYIVDFYAPKANVVVEVDGSQHMEGAHAEADSQRDAYLASEGLRVLRFDNLQVLKEIEGVMEMILRAVSESLEGNPPSPPFQSYALPHLGNRRSDPQGDVVVTDRACRSIAEMPDWRVEAMMPSSTGKRTLFVSRIRLMGKT
jgi:very-short-patch-repair endonuclease